MDGGKAIEFVASVLLTADVLIVVGPLPGLVTPDACMIAAGKHNIVMVDGGDLIFEVAVALRFPASQFTSTHEA